MTTSPNAHIDITQQRHDIEPGEPLTVQVRETRLTQLERRVQDLVQRDDAIIGRIDALAMTRGWESTEALVARIDRLEAIAKNVVPGGRSDMHYKRRLQGHDGAIADLADRLDQLEAWTREEISARTVDEPEDAPEDAWDDEDAWREAARLAREDIMDGKDDFRFLTPDLQRRYVEAEKQALVRLVSLGLAVDPADPRLQPLVMTDELVERVLNDYEQQSRSDPMYRAHLDPIGKEYMRNALTANIVQERRMA